MMDREVLSPAKQDNTIQDTDNEKRTSSGRRVLPRLSRIQHRGNHSSSQEPEIVQENTDTLHPEHPKPASESSDAGAGEGNEGTRRVQAADSAPEGWAAEHESRADQRNEAITGTHPVQESLSSSIGVESQVSSEHSPTTLSRLWLDKEPIDVDWSLYGFEIPRDVLLGGWVKTRDYIRLTTPVPFDQREDHGVHATPSHDEIHTVSTSSQDEARLGKDEECLKHEISEDKISKIQHDKEEIQIENSRESPDEDQNEKACETTSDLERKITVSDAIAIKQSENQPSEEPSKPEEMKCMDADSTLPQKDTFNRKKRSASLSPHTRSRDMAIASPRVMVMKEPITKFACDDENASKDEVAGGLVSASIGFLGHLDDQTCFTPLRVGTGIFVGGKSDTGSPPPTWGGRGGVPPMILPDVGPNEDNDKQHESSLHPNLISSRHGGSDTKDLDPLDDSPAIAAAKKSRLVSSYLNSQGEANESDNGDKALLPESLHDMNEGTENMVEREIERVQPEVEQQNFKVMEAKKAASDEQAEVIKHQVSRKIEFDAGNVHTETSDLHESIAAASTSKQSRTPTSSKTPAGIGNKKLTFPPKDNLDHESNLDQQRHLDLSDLDVLKSARSEDYYSTPLSTFRFNHSEDTYRGRESDKNVNLAKNKSSTTSQTILNSLISAISSVQQDQSSSSKLVHERESLVSLVHDLQAKVENLATAKANAEAEVRVVREFLRLSETEKHEGQGKRRKRDVHTNSDDEAEKSRSKKQVESEQTRSKKRVEEEEAASARQQDVSSHTKKAIEGAQVEILESIYQNQIASHFATAKQKYDEEMGAMNDLARRHMEDMRAMYEVQTSIIHKEIEKAIDLSRQRYEAKLSSMQEEEEEKSKLQEELHNAILSSQQLEDSLLARMREQEQESESRVRSLSTGLEAAMNSLLLELLVSKEAQEKMRWRMNELEARVLLEKDMHEKLKQSHRAELEEVKDNAERDKEKLAASLWEEASARLKQVQDEISASFQDQLEKSVSTERIIIDELRELFMKKLQETHAELDDNKKSLRKQHENHLQILQDRKRLAVNQAALEIELTMTKERVAKLQDSLIETEWQLQVMRERERSQLDKFENMNNQLLVSKEQELQAVLDNLRRENAKLRDCLNEQNNVLREFMQEHIHLLGFMNRTGTAEVVRQEALQMALGEAQRQLERNSWSIHQLQGELKRTQQGREEEEEKFLAGLADERGANLQLSRELQGEQVKVDQLYSALRAREEEISSLIRTVQTQQVENSEMRSRLHDVAELASQMNESCEIGRQALQQHIKDNASTLHFLEDAVVNIKCEVQEASEMSGHLRQCLVEHEQHHENLLQQFVIERTRSISTLDELQELTRRNNEIEGVVLTMSTRMKEDVPLVKAEMEEMQMELSNVCVEMEDEVCKIREMINLQASLRQDNEILRREVGELNSQMNDVLSSWHSPEEFAILKKEKEEAELGVAAHRRQLEENSVRFEQEVKEAKQAREGAVDKINFLEERMNEFARGMASKVKQVARTNLMRFWSKERLSFTQTFFRLFEIAVYMSKTMKQDILSQVFLRECRHAHASSVRVLWAWRFGAAMALNDRKEMKLEETRRHYNKLVVQYARGTLQAVLQAWRHVIERSNESLESKRRAMERQEREEQSAATARKAQIFWAWHVLTMT